MMAKKIKWLLSCAVTVSGGLAPYTYLWSDDDMQTGATAANLGPGDYTVTVTDANGCTITGTVSVISSGQFDFDMSARPAGVYLLKIAVGNDVVTRRLVLTSR